MPRRELEIIEGFPVHITARVNNKERYPAELSLCWEVYFKSLKHIKLNYKILIHAFVMMDNHYHLIATPIEIKSFGKAMNWFQTNTSKQINFLANRINHLYGSNYDGSAIELPIYYAHAIKYVLNNPVTANVCCKYNQYPYSSHVDGKFLDIIETPTIGIDTLIPECRIEFDKWIFDNYKKDDLNLIKKTLKKSKFEFKASRKNGRRPKLHYEI